jgi:putative redox protein
MGTETMTAKIRLMNQKLRFSAAAPEKPEIITDYIPPYGDDEGYYPLEVFLISFGTCAGGTILTMLRKFGRTIASFEINMRGESRNEHPKSFSVIHMEILVVSPDATEDDVQKAIGLSEEKLCPVWAMVRGNVEVKPTFRLNGQ